MIATVRRVVVAGLLVLAAGWGVAAGRPCSRGECQKICMVFARLCMADCVRECDRRGPCRKTCTLLCREDLSECRAACPSEPVSPDEPCGSRKS